MTRSHDWPKKSQFISETGPLICRAAFLNFPTSSRPISVWPSQVRGMLINNKSRQGESDVLSFKIPLMPLHLTTADSGDAGVPVFIHLRKYHSKPHLSCIGCSLTFHFVWQTLIFYLQGVVKEASDSYIPPLPSLRRLLHKELQEHTQREEARRNLA